MQLLRLTGWQSWGIEVELVDVRTLLPFDLTGAIVGSVARTHRVLFVDEDVPGGATAYMMERAHGVRRYVVALGRRSTDVICRAAFAGVWQ